MSTTPRLTPEPAAADPRPVILLTFANDRFGDRAGYLRDLVREQRQLERALADLPADVRVIPCSNARIDDLFDLFARHNDQIIAFHYGGHARPDALVFEDDGGQPAAARVQGVAERLGQLPALRLVFLNGCSTGPQVEIIRRHCRAAIVATDRAIADDVACDFAYRFYDDLSAGRTIEAAFQSAASRVRAEIGGVAEAVRAELAAVADAVHADAAREAPPPRRLRMARLTRTPADDTGWPWHLHADPERPEGLRWRLTDALPPRPRRWPRALAALAALAALTALAAALLAPEPPPAAAPPPDAAPPPEDAAPPDPLRDTNQHVLFRALHARLRAGEDPRALAAAIPPDAPWPIWRLVNEPCGPCDPRERIALREAFAAEALTRLADAPPTPETIARYGRVLLAAEALTACGADGADLHHRVAAALRRWPPPPPATDWVAIDPGKSGLRPYALAPTEVTTEALRRLIPDWRPDDPPEWPARGLDWHTAAAYAAWTGARLPTVAEWNHATAPLHPGARCRRGKRRPLDAIAWHPANADGQPHPVATRADCDGLYDLFGNVRELLAAEPAGCDMVGSARARGGSFTITLDGPDGEWGAFMGGHDFSMADLGLRLAIDRE